MAILQVVLYVLLAAASLAVVVIVLSLFVGGRRARRIFDAFRRWVRRGPRWLTNALRVGGDTFVPGWRTAAGDERSMWQFDARLRSARGMQRPSVVMVGGVYVDISLKPVDVDHLSSVEFANLNEIQTTCGGSAIWVGRYLYKVYKLRSALVSSTGASDPASRQLRSRLKAERWIRKRKMLKVKFHQCGQSVHLIQSDGRFHTTFTHQGALRSLRWKAVHQRVRKLTDRGGLLYISGYFRTGLWLDFEESLKNLSPKILVCVDHGRFLEHDANPAAAELTRAFARDYVDVYLCSFRELCQLASLRGTVSIGKGAGQIDIDNIDSEERVLNTLRTLATVRWLPKITVVRSDVDKHRVTAYIILDGEILVESQDRAPFMVDEPGPRNAFNAGLIYSLVRGDRDEDLRDSLHHAAREALTAWLSASQPQKEPVIVAQRKPDARQPDRVAAD